MLWQAIWWEGLLSTKMLGFRGGSSEMLAHLKTDHTYHLSTVSIFYLYIYVVDDLDHLYAVVRGGARSVRSTDPTQEICPTVDHADYMAPIQQHDKIGNRSALQGRDKACVRK